MAGVTTRDAKGVPLTADDYDNNLETMISLHQGTSEPSPTYACMLWADTQNTLLKMRNTANDGWVTLGALNTNDAFGGISDLIEDTTPQLGGDLETNSNDIKFADNDKAIFGAGSDLQIYHDGSNSYVDDAGTGRLYLRGNDRVQIQKYTGEDMFTAIADGEVKLYYDNSLKFATTSTGIDVTGTVTADALEDSGGTSLLGRRNLIINGNFLIWQRGTNITTGVGYTYGADRWSDYWGMNYLKQSATINNETVNTCKFTSQSSNLYLYYRIEDNLTNAEVSASFYEGKTVSFWYKTNVSSGYEAGIFSGLDQVTVNADEQWHYHTYTHTSTPSNNKFIGVGGATSSTSYIELANVQIEYGSVATPFEHRSYGEELALCQRYYQLVVHAVGCSASTSFPQFCVPFPVEMRATPSLSIFDASGTTCARITDHYFSDYYVTSGASLQLEEGTKQGLRLRINGFSGLTVGRLVSLISANSYSAPMRFDAEL